MKPKTALWASISGTALIAVCCATPVLAITLGALVGYLDYVLLPALVVMVVVSIISYQRYRRRNH
ncbi:mercury resistance system transport protein MerF [Chlorogloea sp. CCALA 695]|uniref:mercury resistance system transport protein MerF n=1 Tax=Chlorogloea sp. CCALA 695 TaxID=2107693 RepID=UPI000D0745C4|nr:mercury resistance system transport protein MerF [Chlorogloea sp. CCALA 695]PSB30884.1 mercury transporter [Chlorogloea sp. CCALA 695]